MKSILACFRNYMNFCTQNIKNEIILKVNFICYKILNKILLIIN